MERGSITVVVPTYNVAAYVPAFLESLAGQQGGTSVTDAVDLVFVDDGSPDDSTGIISAWIDAHPAWRAQVVRKTNGGLSSARNAGLDVATGEWVTFCDPDDVLGDRYFAQLLAFTRTPEADRTHIVAARLVFLDDDSGNTSNTHPLRKRFNRGSRVVDLARDPHIVQVAANTGLFRTEVIRAHGLRYDGSVRPVWEDGHFTARYLSKFERPHLALRADAVYHYRRRRTDGGSLMQSQWTDPAKFLVVPRNGWLDALRIAAAEHGGRVPPWIQNLVLYDLMGYFRQERRSPSPTGNTPRDVSDEFFSIVREVMAYIDLDVLDAYRTNFIWVEIRTVLRAVFKDADPRPREIAVDRLDEDRGLIRLHYYYAGPAPVETFRVRGVAVAPVFAKTRPATFYGRDLMHERLVWLPANGTLTAELDGRLTALRTGPLATPRMHLTPDASWEALTGRPAAERPAPRRPGMRARAGRLRRQVRQRRAERTDPGAQALARARRTIALAGAPHNRVRYRDAWLLIDRDNQAQDNAEHLYRWLRANRPRVNAWFVLSRSSQDWARLAAEGFRLIEHGSREHEIALLNCAHLLSSQIDNYITAPLDPELFGERAQTWRYTFLQHGVTKDDLSIWINPKPIELMITATPAEQRSIVDDSSPYVWSSREVRMTGFPRHDRLLQLARGPAAEEPDAILVMPTWRRSLLLETVTTGNERMLRTDFWDSDYARNWRAVLESDDLHRLAGEQGYQVLFVPHPNMQRYLDTSPLPAHVQVRRFSEVDVQRQLARGVLLVTDYSSMAFETAYLERPVVYFQFDQVEFWSGAHAYRQGSWSYVDDGFGPVTTDAAAAVEAIGEIVARRGKPDPVYARRMADTFPWRDGECSRRTYEAVVDMTRRMGPDELYLELESPEEQAGRPVADELRESLATGSSGPTADDARTPRPAGAPGAGS